MLQQQLDPLMRVAKAHAKGTEEYARSIVHEVLSQFADVEEMFQTSSGVTTEQVRQCTLLVRPAPAHRRQLPTCTRHWPKLVQDTKDRVNAQTVCSLAGVLVLIIGSHRPCRR